MARTYTKLIYHIVFSTKERIPLIAPEIRDRLYEYLGGVIRGEKGSLMEIGGMPDHVHILARFGAAIAVSEMLKRIKGSSKRLRRLFGQSERAGRAEGVHRQPGTPPQGGAVPGRVPALSG